jgi:hypothetical protein
MLYPLSFYTYPLIRGFFAEITQKESKFTVKPGVKGQADIMSAFFRFSIFVFAINHINQKFKNSEPSTIMKI